MTDGPALFSFHYFTTAPQCFNLSRQKTEITMVNMGNCGDLDCLKVCSGTIEAVCGSDGFSYLNECEMDNAACV